MKIPLAILSPLLVVFMSLLLFSCAEDDFETSTSVAPNNTDDADLLNLINSYRTSGCTCGNTFYPAVAPLSWNNLLANSAYGHSKDMDQNNYFSHTGRNGSNPGDRIKAAGYNWMTYGENIAFGYNSEQAVIQGWIESPGHCKNIMNPNFTEMGIGRSGTYWTQDLGRSR